MSLEDGGVAGLLRMVIDHQVDVGQQAAEVVRLHVDQGDLVEVLELVRRSPSRSLMSSSFTIRRFSGRVTACRQPMMAVCLVRRSSVRSARPLAMASGSGSLCVRISTRSASLK